MAIENGAGTFGAWARAGGLMQAGSGLARQGGFPVQRKFGETHNHLGHRSSLGRWVVIRREGRHSCRPFKGTTTRVSWLLKLAPCVPVILLQGQRPMIGSLILRLAGSRRLFQPAAVAVAAACRNDGFFL